jgi:hypothetical protein
LKTFNWVVKESKLPWLPLDIELPYEDMLQEAKDIKHLFVDHRDDDVKDGYGHKGWKSLCIHGIEEYKTNHHTQYGYNSNEETPYKWTSISDKCPITTNWLKNIFPMDTYYRVRFMLLEPGGFIVPHKDSDHNHLAPINVALNHPKNCIFKMEKHGVVPMKPGVAMLLDVGNIHAYINKSNEDRIHIIIHGKTTEKYKDLVIRSYNKQCQNLNM